jgi:hypothetical protein
VCFREKKFARLSSEIYHRHLVLNIYQITTSGDYVLHRRTKNQTAVKNIPKI